MLYKKDGKIKERSRIIIFKDDQQIINPTDEMVIADGWVKYVAPDPVVDNSSALSSDNTSFAGSALAVLSAGSHTIRLAASLIGGASGQIQFQEQDNLVNLVAFEL